MTKQEFIKDKLQFIQSMIEFNNEFIHNMQELRGNREIDYDYMTQAIESTSEQTLKSIAKCMNGITKALKEF